MVSDEELEKIGDNDVNVLYVENLKLFNLIISSNNILFTVSNFVVKYSTISMKFFAFKQMVCQI